MTAVLHVHNAAANPLREAGAGKISETGWQCGAPDLEDSEICIYSIVTRNAADL